MLEAHSTDICGWVVHSPLFTRSLGRSSRGKSSKCLLGNPAGEVREGRAQAGLQLGASTGAARKCPHLEKEKGCAESSGRPQAL